MEGLHLSYSTAGQGGPGHASLYAGTHPYITAAALQAPHPPPPPTAASYPPPPTVGMLPYGVEIPNRVFVGGCPFSMTDQQLGEFFSQYGNVKDSKIIADRSTGKSKGYGFVTFATEEEAVNVHAMGSLFYKEKKLNLSRAIRKCGGQFSHANQEYMNGQRAIWSHPSGYLMQQYDGHWHLDQFSPHSQPVKPCYPYFYPPTPPPAMQPQHFFVNGPTGFSPVATTLPFYPSDSHRAGVDHNDNQFYYRGGGDQGHTHQVEEEKEKPQPTQSEEGEEEESQPSDTSSPAEPASTPKGSSNEEDQLGEKIKQLSLDSAYTSEADLESSTHSSPEEPIQESANEESGGDVAEQPPPPPPDLSKIIKVRKSPSAIRGQRQFKRPQNLSQQTTPLPLSSPPAMSSHYVQGPTYFNPYAYPFTPQSAVQTIGPVYHTHQ